jgi:hypothetical protein
MYLSRPYAIALAMRTLFGRNFELTASNKITKVYFMPCVFKNIKISFSSFPSHSSEKQNK